MKTSNKIMDQLRLNKGSTYDYIETDIIGGNRLLIRREAKNLILISLLTDDSISLTFNQLDTLITDHNRAHSGDMYALVPEKLLTVHNYNLIYIFDVVNKNTIQIGIKHLQLIKERIETNEQEWSRKNNKRSF